MNEIFFAASFSRMNAWKCLKENPNAVVLYPKFKISKSWFFSFWPSKWRKENFFGEIGNAPTLIASKTFSLSRIPYIRVFFVCSRSISIEWYQKHYDIWHSKKNFRLKPKYCYLRHELNFSLLFSLVGKTLLCEVFFYMSR